jgi:hypothetical protein
VPGADNWFAAAGRVRQAGVVIISPRPGVSRDNLLQTLRNVHNGLQNLHGGGSGSAQARVLSYLEWATETTRILDYLVSPADIRRLVPAADYERLLSAAALTGTDIGTQRVLNGMVSLEIDQRVQAFESTIAAVRAQIERWPLTHAFAVPDTSFYIEHEHKLEEADFQSVLGLPGMPVHVLVPIAVVDELDGLKKSKDRDTRWRAGYTLAVLDRVLGSNPAAPGHLRAQNSAQLSGGGTTSGEVTMEIVFDPPGHVRLPISDDEIIDRILAVAPLAERKVTLLTYDTGQATRGRAAGLQVRKLAKPNTDPGQPASSASGADSRSVTAAEHSASTEQLG